MYAHALDITAFIPLVTVSTMTNDDLLGRRDLSLGGIQTATCTAKHHCSSVGL